MQTIVQDTLDLRTLMVNSPVPSRKAWPIESFLLKTFEYGNYSFRRALTGRLSDRLACTFFLAHVDNDIVAAAGSLYSPTNPAIAILGPICTDPSYRRRGLATQLCQTLLDHLELHGVQAAYLGVKDNPPAQSLYRQLGFDNYQGIVMRRLMVSPNVFDKRYAPGQQTSVRSLGWGDYTEVSALLCRPAEIYNFDFCRHIFSARYVQPETFLSAFPIMMNAFAKNGGNGTVLAAKQHGSVVAAAHIDVPHGSAQSHIAMLDFFVLDAFLHRAKDLLNDTLEQFRRNSDRTVLCYCLDCDCIKRHILESLGARAHASLPSHCKINDRLEDVTIYTM